MSEERLISMRREWAQSFFESEFDDIHTQLNEKTVKGHFYAIGPSDAPESSLKDPEYGSLAKPGPYIGHEGRYFERVADRSCYLARVLLRSGLETSAVWFRDAIASSAKSEAQMEGCTKLGNYYYAMFSMRHLGQVQATRLIRKYETSWSFIMLLVQNDNLYSSMDDLLGDATLLAVRAFDGESYVIWSRNEIGTMCLGHPGRG
ncbi:hypothetical protein [Methylobacterium brachiatum]